MKIKAAVVLLITVLCIMQLHAQDCAYSPYNSFTEQARKDIAEKHYKPAREAFKQAFSESVFPLGQDLESALEVAVKLKDDEWALALSIQLANGGIPLRYFSKFRKESWYKAFEAAFPECAAYYAEHFNGGLKEKLLALRGHDITHNNLLHALREGDKEITPETLVASANKLVGGFEALYAEYGFPTEEKMGYYYAKNQITQYPTGVLLVHIYQNGVLLYFDRLDELMCSGVISNSYGQTLQSIRGFGNSTGVEQEIQARFKKYRKG